MSTTAPRVWFITGCSTGFGRALAEQVLQAGDRLIATARHPETLAPLSAAGPDRVRTFALDVTDAATVASVVAEAGAVWDRLDVVVNNAGYGLIGAVEECTSDQIRRCLETNFHGPLNVLRAVLPRLRAQKSGHLINISAAAAIANYAGFGAYGAAKAALEALSDSVRAEVALLGIKVTLVQPGPFRTDFIGRSLERASTTLPDYARTAGKFAAFLRSIDGQQPGDPLRAAAAIVKLVHDGKAPARLPLGKYVTRKIRDRAATMLREVDEWEAVAVAADY